MDVCGGDVSVGTEGWSFGSGDHKVHGLPRLTGFVRKMVGGGGLRGDSLTSLVGGWVD